MEQQSDPEYSDILNKLDALIHRQNETPAVPRVHIPPARQIEYPVLTDIIEEYPVPFPVLTEAIEPEAGIENEMAHEGQSVSEPTPVSPLPSPPPQLSPMQPALSTGDFDTELQTLVDQRILDVLEKRFSPHISAAIDKALSVMLDQFSVHLEEVAREAVAEEIQKQLADILHNQNKL